MKCLIVLIFWTTILNWASAQTCIPEDDHMLLDSTFINDEVDDDFRGTLATFAVTSITAANVANTVYMDVEVSTEDQTVSVFLTDEFENYEAETMSSAVSQIRFQIELTCGTTSYTITFHQPFNDINNNAPVFLQTEYRYRIPMPFLSGIEITQYGEELIARDIDITNSDVTFDVDGVGSNYFSFTSVGTVDNLLKDYKSTMVALRPLEFSTTQTFTLRATDSGTPSQSNSISLIIEVDEENSVTRTPSFSQGLYEVNYKDILNAEESPFAMAITDGKSATFSFSQYEDKIGFLYANGELLVWLNNEFEDNDLDMEGSRQIVVTATVSDLKFTTTVLNVILPTETPPAFVDAFYHVNYDEFPRSEENALRLSITNAESATYTFSEYETNLQYSYEDGELLVWLTNEFDEADLQQEGIRQILITATISELKETTIVLTVILPVVDRAPAFVEAYYDENYEDFPRSEDTALRLSITNAESATYTFSDYETNLEYRYEDGELLVWLINEFDETDLQYEGIRHIVITATVLELKPTRIVLTMTLPIVDRAPVFADAYYDENYEDFPRSEDTALRLSITNAESATYTFSDYETNLEYRYEDGELLVWLINEFDETDLQSEGIRHIVITATVLELKPTRIVLTMTLPVVDRAPVFVDAYYDETYEDFPRSEDTAVRLSINNAESATYTFSDYETNLEYRYEDGELLVWLINEFDETDLQSEGIRYIVITATVSELKPTRIVLTMTLPIVDRAPAFADAYYDENYEDFPRSEDTALRLSITNAESATYTFSDYDTNLEYRYEDSELLVWLINEFDETDLQSEGIRHIVITATVLELKPTRIVLTMTLPIVDRAPAFVDAYYDENYEDFPRSEDTALRLSITNAESATYTFSDYDANLEYRYEDGELLVWLINEFDETDLQSEGIRHIVITANVLELKPTRIVLTMTLPIVDRAPAFVDAYYDENYEDFPRSEDTALRLSITNAESATYTFSDYDTNLEYRYEDGELLVWLINEFDETDLQSEGIRHIVITATVLELKPTRIVLTMTLPIVDRAPAFVDAYYDENYEDFPRSEDTALRLSITNAESATFTFSDYDANLEYRYEDGELLVWLINEFDETDLQSEGIRHIVITATVLELKPTRIVLTMTLPILDRAPAFVDAYYDENYEDFPRSEDTALRLSITNAEPATYTFSDYDANLEYRYEDGELLVWLINEFDESDLQSEGIRHIVITATVLELKPTRIVLTITLPIVDRAPAFVDAYYDENYEDFPRSEDTALRLSITNAESATYTFSDYDTNLEYRYEDGELLVWLINEFDETDLQSEGIRHIVITATVLELKPTRIVLTMTLPIVDRAPAFVDAYYDENYEDFPRSEDTALKLSITNAESATFTSSDYDANLEYRYEDGELLVWLINEFDESDLQSEGIRHIVITATVLELKPTRIVLTMTLPIVDRAPAFADAYYDENYEDFPRSEDTALRLSITNAESATYTFSDYDTNLEYRYEDGELLVWLINEFDESDLQSEGIRHIVITATVLELKPTRIVLTMTLPIVDRAPAFVDAYYDENYEDFPRSEDTALRLSITNAESATFTFSDYDANLEYRYEDGELLVWLINEFDETDLQSEGIRHIVITATVLELKPTRILLTMTLPILDRAPTFVDAYYDENYEDFPRSEDTALTLSITNAESATYTFSDYDTNLEYRYEDGELLVWLINEFDETDLQSEGIRHIVITATVLELKPTRIVLTMTLPIVDRAPAFVDAYYDVHYEDFPRSEDTALRLSITNAESATYTFSDYDTNLEYRYEDGELLVWLIKEFDEADLQLEGIRQIAITATVSELRSTRTVITLTLPIAEDAPLFASAYYDVDYDEFPRSEENALRLAITNAEFATFSFSLYETNLGYRYEAGELLVWLVTELDDADLQLEGIRQIVITATVSELITTRTVLTLTLPIVEAVPLFASAYYDVYYDEFPRSEENAMRLAITNAEFATYSFSLYETNLGYRYEAGELLVWLVTELDDADLQLEGIRQIVITATVSELRTTRTVLTLTLPIVEDAPLFASAYYDVDYDEFPRSEENALRLAITNAEFATYSFSLYETNLEYRYEASELLVWLVTELDEVDLQLEGIRQIVITATVSELRTTRTVLTLTLPIVEDAPLFASAYYEVDYDEFPRSEENALRLAITNAEFATFSFSMYETNLGYRYVAGELLVWLATELDEADLQLEGIRQIVITATVSELRTTRTVLTLTLPIVEDAPLFASAYYDVDYDEFPRSEENALRLAITNAEFATYSFSLYETNLEYRYEAGELLVWLVTELDEADLQLEGIRQIVITATVSELRTTRTVLTLTLPIVEDVPLFASVYYDVDYDEFPRSEENALRLAITNAGFATFSFSLYETNLGYRYEAGELLVWLVTELDEADLQLEGIRQIVITATVSEFTTTRTVLTLILPVVEDAPLFANAYYDVDYDEFPRSEEDALRLAITNAEFATYSFSLYETNLEYRYEDGELLVWLVTELDEADIQLEGIRQIVITATVSELRTTRTVLTLTLPIVEDAPLFASAYYDVDYDEFPRSEENALRLALTNAEFATFSFSLYETNLGYRYEAGELLVWLVTELDEADLQLEGIRQILITATVSELRTTRTVLTLTLPIVEDAPLFASAYYDVDYDEFPRSEENALRLTITNAEFATYSFSLYETNLGYRYEAGELLVWLVTELDDADLQLEGIRQIVITATVSELRTTRTVLTLTLPIVEDAPLFVSAYHDVDYDEFPRSEENALRLAITNAEFATYSFSLYETNLGYRYEAGELLVWLVTELDEADLQLEGIRQIVITATVSELRTTRTVLTLILPVVEDAPLFANAYYDVDYDEFPRSEEDALRLAITNAEFATYSFSLYETNLEYRYEDGELLVWLVTELDEADIQLEGIRQIVITATVSELRTTRTVLTLTLPIVEDAPLFASAYYDVDYDEFPRSEENALRLAITNAEFATFSFSLYETNLGYRYEAGELLVWLVTELDEADLQLEGIRQILITATVSELRTTRTVLTLTLPIVEDAPLFASAYYDVDYDEFPRSEENALRLTITNAEFATYSFSLYETNLGYRYEAGELLVWLVTELDDADLQLEGIRQIVITATVSELRTTRTVLTLTLPIVEDAPLFVSAYHDVDYDEFPRSEENALRLAITNAEFATYSFSLYETNLGYRYEAGELLVWLVTELDDADLQLEGIRQIVITATVSELRTTRTVLTLTLPIVEDAPLFASAYYDVDYDEFPRSEENALRLAITNAEFATYSFSLYETNLEYRYEAGELLVWLVTELDEVDLQLEGIRQIVITATVSELRITRTVLTLTLPIVEDAPLFASAYYEVDYDEFPRSEENALRLAITNAEFATFSFSLYETNLGYRYEAGELLVWLATELDEADLQLEGIRQIVITATVSEFRTTRTVLTLTLPIVEDAPLFASAYYDVDYDEFPRSEENALRLAITNAEFATYSFSLYETNLEYRYEAGELLVWLVTELDEADLQLEGIRQIVITATVSELRTTRTVLTLTLPIVEDVPLFASAYYDVDYDEFPRSEENALRLAITNAGFATFSFSLYETNLGYRYEAGELLVWLVTELDEADLQLEGIRQIVITATVSELRTTRTVLTLTLPVVEDAPLFANAYYDVDYDEFPRSEEDALRLSITNAEFATYSFSLYETNLEYRYEDGELLVWLVTELDEADLQLEGIRQIVITATVSELRTTRTVLTLTLPIVEDAPLFASAYYDVDYDEFPRSEENALRLAITNAEFATFSFSLYETNLGYRYEAFELLVWLVTELDEADLQLEGIRQILITATVSELRTTRTVLTLTLPIVEDAPLFASAYYDVDYDEFPRSEENALRLTITNAEFATYSFSLYETNLGYRYEAGELLVWLVTELDDADLQLEGIRQIVITATVSELRTTRTVLTLTLPRVEGAPLFASAYYDVDYDEFPRSEENALRLAITNAEFATYSFSLYETNLEYRYEAGELLVWLVTELDEADLQLEGIRQIVITATVSELRTTRTVLTLTLPILEDAPLFASAYHDVDYDEFPRSEENALRLAITNAEFATFSFSLYETNLGYRYEAGELLVWLVTELDEADLQLEGIRQIVITATVSELRTTRTVLTLTLPIVEDAPLFASAYYDVDYDEFPRSGENAMRLAITNAEFATYSFSLYETNLGYRYEAGELLIWLVTELDDADLQLEGIRQIVITATVSELRTTRTVLTLTLPIVEDAPLFASAYYDVDYDEFPRSDENALRLAITNAEFATFSFSLYETNLGYRYEAGELLVWWVTELDEADLQLEGIRQIVITATVSELRTTRTVLTLTLPVVEDAPLFANAYYDVDYDDFPRSEENALRLAITNAEFATYSFSLYQTNLGYRYEAGELLVWMVTELDDADLQLEGIRQIVITATVSELRTTRTVLTLTLPIVEAAPLFASAYYDVDYDEFPRSEENAMRLAITNAEFATYSFSLYETNLGYRYEAGELLVWLITELDDADLQLEGIRQIVITATVSELRTTRTVLTLTLPIVEDAPSFASAYYDVDYDEFPRSEENALRLAITNAEFATFSFSLYETNLGYRFEAGGLLVWLVTELDDADLQLEGIRQIVITATVSQLRTTRTVLTLTLPIVEAAPLFASAYYDVDYDEFPRSEENALRLSITNAESATYTFSDYETNLVYRYEDGELLVWLINEFDEADLQSEGIRHIVITATVSELKFTRSVLTVILPVMLPKAAITFEGAPFKFTLTSSETLATVALPLTATSTFDEEIIYSSTDIPSELQLDHATAILTNTMILDSGIYEFHIIATGETSRVTETADVTIDVTALEICNNELVMRYSHFLTYQVENEAKSIIPLTIETELNLKYEIVEVSPVEGKDLFEIRDGYLYCNELDREADHFANMEVAQYIITAKVSVEEEEVEETRNYRNGIFNTYNKNAYASTRAEDTCQCATVGSIETRTYQTQITIVVLDENDNSPVFSPSTMVNGYPARSLLSTITPSSILQVEATDADFGVNAQLYYYVDSPYVTIHPTTGVIYPTDAFPDNDFSFTVTAKDQNGNGYDSTNALQVEIKILGQEHISVLTVKNHLIEDADDKILEFNELGNINIHMLQSSVTPSQTTSQTARQARADEDYYLVITAYAFDANENLITSDSLGELLGDVADLSIDTLPDATPDCDEECDCDDCDPDNCVDCEVCEVCGDCDDCECNAVGFIVAVSILSVLLFLVIVGFVVFYYFKIRKNKSYDHMEEEGDRRSTPPQFAKNITMARSTSKLSQVSDKPERRPTGIIFATPGDSDDHTSPHTSPPTSPPRERKSVAFNANVEQIHIDTTNDNDIESSKL